MRRHVSSIRIYSFDRAKSPFRHVAKTGDIKDFVILEESGIAKGIRRLIGVTGQEAAEAKRQAQILTERLNQLEVSEGKEKNEGLKAFTFVSA